MPISEVVLITMGLLAVAMVAAGLFRRAPVPYSVLLVILGVGLGELAGRYPWLADLSQFRLTPELVFFLFLPVLIFESGLNLDARQLLKELRPVLTLAVPALLLSTTLVGLGLSLLLGMELHLALLFGALISATDPVAVVALFKELGAPLRLTVLVEGESLFNDATAIVVFSILLSMSLEGTSVTWLGLGAAAVEFLRVFLGGAAVGLIAGLLLIELMRWLRSSVSEVMACSLIMAYVSFIVAEHWLHLSGVMATIAAAITLGVYGMSRIPGEISEPLEEIWELLSLLANSLLFLLVGLSIDLASLLRHLDEILLVVLVITLARGAAVYGLIPLAGKVFTLPHIGMAERHIMWWGGLKGGLAIAMVLSIPEQLPGRDLLLNLTLGVVLFTLLVNAWSIRPLMRWLGLDRMNEDDQAEREQGLSMAVQSCERMLRHYRQHGLLDEELGAELGERLHALLDQKPAGAPPAYRGKQVYQAALNLEREQLQELYDNGVIGQYILLEIRSRLRQDKDRHSGDVAGVEPPGGGLFQLFEHGLIGRLREQNWAAGLLARYQNWRLTRHVERNLAGTLMASTVLDMLAREEGMDAAARHELAEIYRQRLQRRRQRLQDVGVDYPGFYQGLAHRVFERATLMHALNDADEQRHQGTLGMKAYQQLRRLLEHRLEALAAAGNPSVDGPSAELVAGVPLFAGLDAAILGEISRRAQVMNFLPGDIIIEQGDRGDALYILTRGEALVLRRERQGADAVVVSTLGAGNFFGEAALLEDHRRTATVRARQASTLMRVRRRDVLHLAQRYPLVGQRLQQAHQARRRRDDDL